METTSDEMVAKIEKFWFNGNRVLAVLLASQNEDPFVLMPFYGKIRDNIGIIQLPNPCIYLQKQVIILKPFPC